MRDTDYCFRRELAGTSYSDAVERVTEALAEEGFGVLTTIDVKETLKEKLDVPFRPYVILGACNPHLAHDALRADDTVGLLLPCNVVVAETDDGAEVAILDPDAMLSLSGSEALDPVAEDARVRLTRVLNAL